MWRQIPWVANGLTLQGGLELVMGLVILLGAADSDAKAPTTFRDVVLLRIAPPCLLVAGSVKAFAGRTNRRFRGRIVGLWALWSALPTAVAWLCAPTGLALLVYGIIVYRDRTSREAFSLAEGGKSPEEVMLILSSEARRPA